MGSERKPARSSKTRAKPEKKAPKRPAEPKAPRAARKRSKGAAAAALVEALARHGFPTAPGPGLGFTPEDDARLERGWPHLRIVTDEAVSDARAIQIAEKALDAIDPVLRVRVPRAVARAFLLGYEVGPLLFVDRNHPRENAARREARARAIRSDRAIDLPLLESTLARQVVGMGDTYGRWRTAKVLYLYEHFLGTEAVARAATAHLLHCASEPGVWGPVGDPTRTNAAPHHLALALPWLLRRVPSAVATELRARLGAVRTPREVGTRGPRAYHAMLHAIAEPGAPLHSSLAELSHLFGFFSDDVRPVSAFLDRWPYAFVFDVARVAWVLGTARFAGELKIAGRLLPPLVDAAAPIRDPSVVRLMARIATQRAGAAAASEWLRERADYARPILTTLAGLDDEKESKAAARALELIGSAEPAGAEPLDEAALEAEIARIFEQLGVELRATSDRDAQAEHIRAAHEAYAEARAAAGDPIPEAYFTHRFGDFGLGQWAMLAVDAID